METPQTIEREAFINWLNGLPEEAFQEVARKIAAALQPELPPGTEPEAQTSRYSQTVLDAIKNHKGPSLLEFLLDNRLELPDDIDFSRPSGGSREIEF